MEIGSDMYISLLMNEHGLFLSSKDREYMLNFASHVFEVATKQERDRCALVCDELKEITLSAAKCGSSDEFGNVMLRQVAFLGYDAAAEAIRKDKKT